jgi:transcriptional regulator with XRE-family HTH domain
MGDAQFGHHIRRLRTARGMSQETLASLACLSTDTIRKVEIGGFSPSLLTLRKLCAGLDLNLSTLFAGYELHGADAQAALLDLVSGRESADMHVVLEVVGALLSALDEQRAAGRSSALDAGPDPPPR